MTQFNTRISKGTVNPKIGKIVLIILGISAVSFALVKVVLFLPIPNSIKPNIFSETPAFVIAFLVGIICFIVIYILLMASDNYRNVTITIDEDRLNFKGSSVSKTLKFSDILGLGKPEYETKKFELALKINKGQMIIRFKSDNEMTEFDQLIKSKIKTSYNNGEHP